MSFIIAFVLAAFTAALYFNGPGWWPINGICSNTFDLCQHPGWPFAAAIAFGLGGLVFRANML
jgi:hypothetical protein